MSKTYNILLPYDPLKYKQRFESGNFDMTFTAYDNDTFLWSPEGLQKFRTDFKSAVNKYVEVVTPAAYLEFKELMKTIVLPTAQDYTDVFTLLALNENYSSIDLDRQTLIADNSSNRSFTDLCSLGFYYGILKTYEDILPFFLHILKMLDKQLLNVGYCWEIQRFIFEFKRYCSSGLIFGGNASEFEDLTPFSNWPFLNATNSKIVIGDGIPEYRPVEEDEDWDDDDEW